MNDKLKQTGIKAFTLIWSKIRYRNQKPVPRGRHFVISQAIILLKIKHKNQKPVTLS